MDDILARVMCERGLTTGFAEVRRLISGKAITINGILATSYDQKVYSGDVIKCGKHKSTVV